MPVHRSTRLRQYTTPLQATSRKSSSFPGIPLWAGSILPVAVGSVKAIQILGRGNRTGLFRQSLRPGPTGGRVLVPMSSAKKRVVFISTFPPCRVWNGAPNAAFRLRDPEPAPMATGRDWEGPPTRKSPPPAIDRRWKPNSALGTPAPVPEPALDHLIKLTDDTGLFQHARFTIPNRAHGYCSDDNARGAIAMTEYYAQYRDPQALRLLDTYSGLPDARPKPRRLDPKLPRFPPALVGR